MSSKNLDARAELPKRTGGNLLMIAYAYPPLGSPGALRVAKFAKYLPEHGWRPVVITPRTPYSRIPTGLDDHVDLPGVRVVRTFDLVGADVQSAAAKAMRSQGLKARILGAISSLAIPDHTITWYPFAMRAAARAIRDHQVSVIYSTSPRVTNHLIARAVARRFGLPWVADFRDLWTLAPTYSRDGWRIRIDRAIERAVLRDAWRILVVSNGPRAQLDEAYPEFSAKVSVLRNGYDDADLGGTLPQPPTDRFVLTYCGMFYGGKRSPAALLRALASLKTQGVLSNATFAFNIVGKPESDVQDMVAQLDVGDLVEFVGQLPYREAIGRMARSSAGLVITMTDDRSRGEMPTKFFECLGVRRPILALSPPEFELAKLTETIGAGTAIHPQDCEGIARWISDQIGRQQSNGPSPNLDESRVRHFSRAAAAAQLAECLDEVVGQRAGVPARGADKKA